eukprot:2798422-Prymnesium_polylepis.2
MPRGLAPVRPLAFGAPLPRAPRTRTAHTHRAHAPYTPPRKRTAHGACACAHALRRLSPHAAGTLGAPGLPWGAHVRSR